MDEATARAKIHDLLITGDNRLKQGVAPEKVKQTWLEALAIARELGLDGVEPLVQLRLADLESPAEEQPPPVPPAA